MNDRPGVSELRLVVTAPDYEQALQFCRDCRQDPRGRQAVVVP